MKGYKRNSSEAMVICYFASASYAFWHNDSEFINDKTFLEMNWKEFLLSTSNTCSLMPSYFVGSSESNANKQHQGLLSKSEIILFK